MSSNFKLSKYMQTWWIQYVIRTTNSFSVPQFTWHTLTPWKKKLNMCQYFIGKTTDGFWWPLTSKTHPTLMMKEIPNNQLRLVACPNFTRSYHHPRWLGIGFLTHQPTVCEKNMQCISCWSHQRPHRLCPWDKSCCASIKGVSWSSMGSGSGTNGINAWLLWDLYIPLGSMHGKIYLHDFGEKWPHEQGEMAG